MGLVSFLVMPNMKRLRDYWKSGGSLKKPYQFGFREYFPRFNENPFEPWNEITADETIQGIKALK